MKKALELAQVADKSLPIEAIAQSVRYAHLIFESRLEEAARDFTPIERQIVDQLFSYFSSDPDQRTLGNVAKLYCYLFIAFEMEGDDPPDCYDWSLLNQIDQSQVVACMALFMAMLSRHVDLRDGRLVSVSRLIARAAFDAASLRQAESYRERTAAKARKAVDAKHGAPGGSRSKREAIKEAWASGKYDNRDRCAEEECGALGISFSTARKALRNTPSPA